jgi:hypothetical protein
MNKLNGAIATVTLVWMLGWGLNANIWADVVDVTKDKDIYAPGERVNLEVFFDPQIFDDEIGIIRVVQRVPDNPFKKNQKQVNKLELVNTTHILVSVAHVAVAVPQTAGNGIGIIRVKVQGTPGRGNASYLVQD